MGSIAGAGLFTRNAVAMNEAERTPSNQRTTNRSRFNPEAGFADLAPWLDDDTPVYRVTEPTREALENAANRSGPRVVVFETSGTIDLGMEPLEITNDKCWIAGQTAPSPGVTLIRGGFYVNASDCVVQHIRVRPGDAGAEEGDDWQPDAMHTGDDTRNNIIDHCSTSWAVDETLSVGYRTRNTTLSNCIIAEGLNDATHTKGEHGYGTLVGDCAKNVVMVGNAWAHNTGRNPASKGGTTTVIANNIIYHATDWITSFGGPGECGDTPARSAVENNAYVRIGSHYIQFGHVHFNENYTTPGSPPAAVDERLDQRPLWPEGLDPLPASAVIGYQSAYVGARPADRTYQDQRIVNDIINRTGEIIDSQEEVGGYPELPANTRELEVPESGLRGWLNAHAKRVEQPDDVEYYQVDLIVGSPLENLSADTLYAEQDRLLRFARGEPEEGFFDKGTAWPSEEVRECLEYGHINSPDDGKTARAVFMVGEECEREQTVSLVVYSASTETFDVNTVNDQELLYTATYTYGPGEHAIAVPLPTND